MRKFCLINFIFVISLITVFAQEDKPKVPGIELPDFVITGKDVIAVKKSDKIKPEFVTTISENFIKPSYSPEELEISEFSLPIKKDLSFLDSTFFHNGYISAGLGRYSFPFVDALYGRPIENGILRLKFTGFNNKEYVDNSDRYGLKFGADLLYWTNIDSRFLPGTQIHASGEYGTDGYKFFASDNPTEKRSLNAGRINLNIKNEFNPNFLFDFMLDDQITSIQQEPFNENNLNLKAQSLFKVSFFNIGIAADYRNHAIKNYPDVKTGKDIVIFRPTAGFQFTKVAKGSFGVTISNSGGDKFFNPYASVALKLSDALTLFGEYNASPEFFGPAHYLKQNIYLDVDSLSSIYFEKGIQYSVSVKYEFSRYYQIDGGLKFYSAKDYPYFADSYQKGKFVLAKTDVTSLSPFINFLFYIGPYGEFYSSAEVNMLQNDSDNFIPYSPKLKLNAIYSYKFSESFIGSLRADYLSGRYADIQNKIKLDDYFDLGVDLNYIFNKQFDFFASFRNIFNTKNYLWYNYQEVPLNFLFGVKYKL
ncbi:MAG: TonB-dependent receptor [Ignavibacterium album]|uniref:TonB-dependent receptor n=1 Tax=Ignavibacterium album TaxID=591197 RepID=UPI0026E973ED|nr:TonB-dependent receptor [Ignavibacterium album]MBI5660878.1 TonB-dependent receptor [Ignavibacterium album]